MSATLAAVLFLSELFGVLLAVDAVMRPRSAQGAIAWSVALVCIPIITIPFYLVFGRTGFQGYAEAIREKEAQLDERMAGWYRAMAAVGADPHPDLGHMDVVVRQLTGVPFTRGNRVELLVDAEATYGSMREAIAAAESYVLVQFYIVRDDESGRALRDALIERARAGVRVCFLYDEIGSHALPGSYKQELREAGVQVSEFNTRKGRRNRFQLNFRNHRKIVVTDGRVAWIGVHNVGDEYLGKDPKISRVVAIKTMALAQEFEEDELEDADDDIEDSDDEFDEEDDFEDGEFEEVDLDEEDIDEAVGN